MLRREQSFSLNTFSITLVQKREKDERSMLFCEVGPKEAAIEQFFNLGLAAAVRTKDLQGHYILP